MRCKFFQANKENFREIVYEILMPPIATNLWQCECTICVWFPFGKRRETVRIDCHDWFSCSDDLAGVEGRHIGRECGRRRLASNERRASCWKQTAEWRDARTTSLSVPETGRRLRLQQSPPKFSAREITSQKVHRSDTRPTCIMLLVSRDKDIFNVCIPISVSINLNLLSLK